MQILVDSGARAQGGIPHFESTGWVFRLNPHAQFFKFCEPSAIKLSKQDTHSFILHYHPQTLVHTGTSRLQSSMQMQPAATAMRATGTSLRHSWTLPSAPVQCRTRHRANASAKVGGSGGSGLQAPYAAGGPLTQMLCGPYARLLRCWQRGGASTMLEIVSGRGDTLYTEGGPAPAMALMLSCRCKQDSARTPLASVRCLRMQECQH